MEIAALANEATFISGVAGTMIAMTLIVRFLTYACSLGCHLDPDAAIAKRSSCSGCHAAWLMLKDEPCIQLCARSADP